MTEQHYSQDLVVPELLMENKMIKICKLPYIYEDTDRWGRPLGTFSVMDVQGEIDEQRWAKIQEYEGYYLSEGAKEDEAIMKKHIDDAIVFGNSNVNNLPKLPNLSKVIGYVDSLIWQFNLLTKNISEEESEYVRSYAVFGEVTLHTWTPEHEERVKYLKEQAKQMNDRVKND